MQPDILQKPQVLATWSATFFTRLYRYKALLKRRWWVLLLSFSICISYEAYQTAHTPPLYTSHAQMIISPRINTQEKTSYSEELGFFIGTQIQLMKSAEVNSRALNRVRATHPELPVCPTGLDVFQTPRTSIFELVATGSEPKFTRAYLDAVMQEFIKFKDEMRSNTSDKTLSSLTEQIQRLGSELHVAQENLFEFQKANDVVFLQEQGNTAAQYLSNLDHEIADMKKESQLLDLLGLEENLRRANAVANNNPLPDSTSQTVNGTSTSNATSNQTANATAPAQTQKQKDSAESGKLETATSLYQQGPEGNYLKTKNEIQVKQTQLDELSINLKAQHPKIQALKEDIARLQRLLEIYKIQGMAELKSRQDGIQVRLANSENLRKEWEKKALDSTRKIAEYNNLKSEIDSKKNLYDHLNEVVQSIDVNSNINQNEIQIFQYADPPQTGVNGLTKNLLTGTLFGLVLGVAVLFLLDRIDDRVNSFSELRDHFDEQVLGQIPMESIGKGERVEMLTADDSRQVYAEAFRNVRSSLMYMALEGERPKTLLVTSAIPNEGKSTVACNLAVTMALAGSRVLLIDADARKGVLHGEFQLHASPGLTEILHGQLTWQEAVKDTANPNLKVITRGQTSTHAGELLLSPACNNLLTTIRDAYDYVVIDSAPVLATDDTPSLAPKIDGVLMVLRASHTSARLSRSSLDALYQRQVNILGIVFNCIDTNLPDYYHYQYYKYYYSQT